MAAPAHKNLLLSRLTEIVTARTVTVAERQKWLNDIASFTMHNSPAIDHPNFTKLAQTDLTNMIVAYDERFFDGSCVGLAHHYGISFRLSSRMTKAGGKTTRTVYPAYGRQPERTDYEIALSTSLLFQTFRGSEREIRVCGLNCNDRLQAMQRIVEHELIHLAEMLVWTHSECAASRFQRIAHRLFGHTEHRHELVTQAERAKKEFNIRLGDYVKFRVDNKQLVGRVNRITRRATVLVESTRGVQYSDGKLYERYYVPLGRLTRVAH